MVDAFWIRMWDRRGGESDKWIRDDRL